MNSTRQRLLDVALQHFAETGEHTISVTELSRRAGVARGTIYNNFDNIDDLFSIVSLSVYSTLNEDAERMIEQRDAPHERLACYLGLFMRRAHNRPHWAKFVVKFAPYEAEFRDIASSILLREVQAGMKSGIFTFTEDKFPYFIQMLAGTTYGFVFLITEGHKSWRETSKNLIELLLISGGVPQAEAARVADLPLPQLTQPLTASEHDAA